MNRFDDGEIEIAVLTRNRDEILGRFLESQIEDIKKMNASLSIYDSSSDGETEKQVRHYQESGYRIRYQHDNFDTLIDEKYFNAIINSKAKYIWIMGDSNYMDFPTFCKKGYAYIKSSYEVLAVFNEHSVREKESIDYTDPVDLFGDCLWHLTWLGGPVIRRDIFDGVVTEEKKKSIIQLSNTRNGSWYTSIGLLFQLLSQSGKFNARVVGTDTKSLATVEKKQAWVADAYKIWCKDLCLLADSLGTRYKAVGDKAIADTWKVLNLDKLYWSSRFRASGSLNRAIFDEYDAEGYIDRVSSHKKRIRIWAYMPRFLSVWLYGGVRCYILFRGKAIKIVKKMIRRKDRI